MVSKGFFLDLMTFLTHIIVRPNDFLKPIFLCTTILCQTVQHRCGGGEVGALRRPDHGRQEQGQRRERGQEVGRHGVRRGAEETLKKAVGSNIHW